MSGIVGNENVTFIENHCYRLIFNQLIMCVWVTLQHYFCVDAM